MKLPPLPSAALTLPKLNEPSTTKLYTEAQVNADRLAVAEAVKAEAFRLCVNKANEYQWPVDEIMGICADAIKNMEIEI